MNQASLYSSVLDNIPFLRQSPKSFDNLAQFLWIMDILLVSFFCLSYVDDCHSISFLYLFNWTKLDLVVRYSLGSCLLSVYSYTSSLF